MTGARELWVRPPLLGREAPPPWLAVWRFRLALLLALALLVLVFVLVYRELSGANEQDPGVGPQDPGASAPPVPGVSPPPAAG